jgi:hypothetical protein
MKMMNRKKWDKKGWLKVLEAVIAISLLIGVLLYIMATSTPKKDISGVANEREEYILDSISKNNTLRSDIINGINQSVNNTIKQMLPSNWNFMFGICDLDAICNPLGVPNDRDVYANEIVITSNNTVYNPKKFRLFIWLR